MSTRSLDAHIRKGKIHTCKKKDTFETVVDAGIRAAYLYLNNGWFNSTYECSNCGKYHLTTKYKISAEHQEKLAKFVSERRFTRNDRPIHIE
jgi:hypothetical protein